MTHESIFLWVDDVLSHDLGITEATLNAIRTPALGKFKKKSRIVNSQQEIAFKLFPFGYDDIMPHIKQWMRGI